MTEDYKLKKLNEIYGSGNAFTRHIEFNDDFYICDKRYNKQNEYKYICPITGNVLITSDFKNCKIAYPGDFLKNNPYILVKQKAFNDEDSLYLSSEMGCDISRCYEQNPEWIYEKIIDEENADYKFYLKWIIKQNDISNYE